VFLRSPDLCFLVTKTSATSREGSTGELRASPVLPVRCAVLRSLVFETPMRSYEAQARVSPLLLKRSGDYPTGMVVADTAGRFIAIAKQLTPGVARPIAARLLDATTDSFEGILGRKAPLTPPLRLRLHSGPFSDPRLYRMSAVRNLGAFRELCGMRPQTSFLDIGCGTGRMASALTRYLSSDASYEGFDVAREPVEWCQREISSRFPNFRFQRVNTLSQRYNPQGETSSSKLIFPYDDNRFDFVFAGSVYTHMLPADVAKYISETARVLKPGGTTFSTFCLLNERSRSSVSAGRSSPPLPYTFGECRIRDPANPESFIAQPEQFVRDTYVKAGLSICEPIRYGSWTSLHPEDSELLEPCGFIQDVLIASKR
jgi:SAM-dependent methyltransferase